MDECVDDRFEHDPRTSGLTLVVHGFDNAMR
jgi:hypothetical protein